MADSTKLGAFIETTNIFDLSQITSMNINSPEFKQFLVQLTQTINNLSLLLNTKESGYYPLTEFVCNQLLFPDQTLNSLSAQPPTYRQIYRILVQTGQLPNTATINIPHGLSPTANWSYTRIYGTATDTTGLIALPLPYASVMHTDSIALDIDATNINIRTWKDRTNYNISLVIIEYVKQ